MLDGGASTSGGSLSLDAATRTPRQGARMPRGKGKRARLPKAVPAMDAVLSRPLGRVGVDEYRCRSAH